MACARSSCARPCRSCGCCGRCRGCYAGCGRASRTSSMRSLAALAAARALGMPLVVVGPQKDHALAQALRDGGADLRGYVPEDELVRLYQRAACLVHPSLYEGFALTPAEAMACGTPVVARPDAAVRELVGDAGILTEDLAAGVERALA